MVRHTQKSPPETATPTTAVAKPAPAASWPTPEKVRMLAELLDRNYPDYQAILKSLGQLKKATAFTRKSIIREAEKIIDHFEKTGGQHGARDGCLQKRLYACCPQGWWPEDCDGSPARGEVAKMIAVLMGSFPTSKIPEPTIFVPVLLEDVMALNPDFLEMEATCRALRTSKKFMPSISEVIEELEKQKKLWDRRYDVAENLEYFYNELRTAIACAKQVEAVPAIPVIEHSKVAPVAPVAPIDTPAAVNIQRNYDDKF
jgi:hypothetical protein